MADVTRWNPFDELASFWPRDLFSFRRPDGELGLEWRPRCDVTQSDNEIVVHAELPGVEAKDIDVTLDQGVLTVRGEKRTEKQEEDKGRTRSERFFGSFERRIVLGADVDEEKIEASLKDGVLEVRLPKVAPAVPTSRQIPIKS